MYQTNQAFLEAMDDISRTLAVQVEIGGELYPTESIIDFELERGAFDGDVFTIGQTLSSALTLTIFTTSSIKLGDEVKLFTDLWVGDSYVRVPMGVYYVDATSINQEKMTLTCYDKMVSLVEEYIPNGQHKTLSALFNDVRSQIGMTYDGAFTDVAIKAPLYGYTYRETLGFIASLNGGNMIINRSGNLEIKGYQAVERHIPAKTCFSFDVKEPYRVSKVFCQFGDVGVTRGDSSGQCVAFENPYVTEQNIDVIYQRLNGLNFTAGSLKYRGDLTLDPGDLFTFTDYKGDDYVLMCGRNKLTFNGGLSGQLESIGESEKANNYTELQLKYKKNLTKVTAELGKIQAVVQEIEQSHDGLEERVKNAELEMTADAITSKIKDTFVSKDEAGNLVTQEQLTSAIRQTSNDITQSVSSTYATKTDVTSSINGVNSSISSLTTRISSAESKITDTAITNTVKQNFYTKTETDGKVTTVQNSMNSSITQLSNQIATKVDVNGVKSTIEQNPSSVQIGFNKISDALTVSADGLVAKTQSGNKYFQLGYNGMTMYNPANGTHQWGKVAAINNKFTVASNGNSSGLSLGHHVNENYVEDILCDSNGIVTVQRQMNHVGIYNNTYGQMFIRQSGQGGWEITGRSDSQTIKPGGANQGAVGSNTQYINQSWIANRQNPSSLEYKHLSHYVEDLECIKLVSEVQPARFFYKEYDEEGNDITTFTTRTSQLGLIYEDVRECTGRDLITNEEDKAINLYNMVSTLWGAVRNLNQRLNELEIENLKLNNELDQIKATQKEAK